MVEETGKAKIRALANARSFERYVTDGPYNTYYNQFHAETDGECWLGKAAIDRVKKIVADNAWETF